MTILRSLHIAAIFCGPPYCSVRMVVDFGVLVNGPFGVENLPLAAPGPAGEA